jgi:hypothetical protein
MSWRFPMLVMLSGQFSSGSWHESIGRVLDIYNLLIGLRTFDVFGITKSIPRENIIAHPASIRQLCSLLLFNRHFNIRVVD